MPLVRAIDVDVAFALSFVVDGAWLWATGQVAAVRVPLWRLAAAAAVGAAADVAAQFPVGWPLGTLAGRVVGTAVVLAVAFGGACPPRALARLAAFFLGMGALMAGAGLLAAGGGGRGLALLPSGPGTYTAYVAPPATSPWVAVGVALALAGGRLVLDAAAAWWQLGRGTRRLQVRLGGGQVALVGLVDTGNQLREPLSGRPVVVVEAAALGHLLPPAVAAAAAGPGDAQVLAALPPEWAARCRLVPYRAVGTDQGLLLAVWPDGLWVEGCAAPAYVALAPAPLDPGGAYRALIPAGLATGHPGAGPGIPGSGAPGSRPAPGGAIFTGRETP